MIDEKYYSDPIKLLDDLIECLPEVNKKDLIILVGRSLYVELKDIIDVDNYKGYKIKEG